MESMKLIVGGLVIIFIQGYVAWYFTYWKKKGENTAIKEDIEEITKRTKTIESEINHLTQNKINLVTEKRNAIVNYNYELSILKYYVQFQISLVFDPDKIMDQFFENVYSKYSFAESKLTLLFDEKPIKIEVKMVNQAIIEIVRHETDTRFELKNIASAKTKESLDKALKYREERAAQSIELLNKLNEKHESLQNTLRGLLAKI